MFHVYLSKLNNILDIKIYLSHSVPDNMLFCFFRLVAKWNLQLGSITLCNTCPTAITERMLPNLD